MISNFKYEATLLIKSELNKNKLLQLLTDESFVVEVTTEEHDGLLNYPEKKIYWVAIYTKDEEIL